jgi:hypothetical protein
VPDTKQGIEYEENHESYDDGIVCRQYGVQVTIKKLTVSKLVLVQKEDDVDMAIEFQRL